MNIRKKTLGHNNSENQANERDKGINKAKNHKYNNVRKSALEQQQSQHSCAISKCVSEKK